VYIEYAVADSRQGVVLLLRGLRVCLTTPHPKNNVVTKCKTRPNIIRMIESRSMSWGGHVALIGRR
jgi:hypothetical protein